MAVLVPKASPAVRVKSQKGEVPLTGPRLNSQRPTLALLGPETGGGRGGTRGSRRIGAGGAAQGMAGVASLSAARIGGVAREGG